MDKLLRDYKEDWSSMDQRLTRLERDVRQPRLAMKADRPANTKTGERTESAATAVQAMHRDNCTAQRVKDGPNTNSTSFGMMAEPLDLPCRDGVLVENDDVSLKLCVPSLKMRSPTAARGLLLTGEASKAASTKETNPKETN